MIQDTIANELKQFDVLIIGGGAAGFTSAMYAVRRNLRTLILSKNMGGATATTEDIENYPGYFPDRSGYKLMQTMEEQAKKFGAHIEYDPVVKIEKKQNRISAQSQIIYLVHTDSGMVYETKTIIFAYGRGHRHLDVPGEKEFFGKGVVYCATCDAPLYKNKIVAVIGGGNSALDAAVLLSKIAKKVYLIHRRNEFRGETVLIDRVKNSSSVELVLDTQIKKICGTDFVSSIIIEKKNDEGTFSEKTLFVDGVFVSIGFVSDTTILAGLSIALDSDNQIIVDDRCRTNLSGIFAAGDVSTVPYKQTVISAGQGAIAALEAERYITHTENGNSASKEIKNDSSQSGDYKK